jgi:Flp pilus assembly protein CpaB
MKQSGRILLFLIVIIVILAGAAFFVFSGGGGFLSNTQEAVPTPPSIPIVMAAQPIERDAKITTDMLTTMDWPQDRLTEKMITNVEALTDKYAVYPLAQGIPITTDMISDRPGLSQPGSDAAKVISPGLVAISIPIDRLSAVAYGIRDGDRVNVIATTMFVDVDTNFQSILPNNFGQVFGTGTASGDAPLLTMGSSSADGGAPPAGRAELDPVLNQAAYYVPSEAQRPRLVSQMILQNIQVLRIGTFDLSADSKTAAPASDVPDAAAAEGQAAAPTPTPAPIVAPDIITLIVYPQDAIALTYLMYSGAEFTLTLRAPDDSTNTPTEAATLQYILSQYAIPIPVKLPYAVEPSVKQLQEPTLLNDEPTPLP